MFVVVVTSQTYYQSTLVLNMASGTMSVSAFVVWVSACDVLYCMYRCTYCILAPLSVDRGWEEDCCCCYCSWCSLCTSPVGLDSAVLKAALLSATCVYPPPPETHTHTLTYTSPEPHTSGETDRITLPQQPRRGTNTGAVPLESGLLCSEKTKQARCFGWDFHLLSCTPGGLSFTKGQGSGSLRLTYESRCHCLPHTHTLSHTHCFFAGVSSDLKLLLFSALGSSVALCCSLQFDAFCFSSHTQRSNHKGGRLDKSSTVWTEFSDATKCCTNRILSTVGHETSAFRHSRPKTWV